MDSKKYLTGEKKETNSRIGSNLSFRVPEYKSFNWSLCKDLKRKKGAILKVWLCVFLRLVHVLVQRWIPAQPHPQESHVKL